MKNFIPRGWTKNTNEHLQTVYNEACNKAIELGLIDYTPDLYIFKSTRTWGWARYPRHYDYNKQPYVGLNAVYLKDPAKALNTICHELAHRFVLDHSQRFYQQLRKLDPLFAEHRQALRLFARQHPWFR